MLKNCFGEEARKSTLSKKELKRLRARAKTADDYQKLAAYYRQQAQHFEGEQKKHEEMARECDKASMDHPTKYPTRAASCRNLAAAYILKAKKAYTLADQYGEKAKQAAK